MSSSLSGHRRGRRLEQAEESRLLLRGERRRIGDNLEDVLADSVLGEISTSFKNDGIRDGRTTFSLGTLNGETLVGGTYFEADTPLVGPGNPPKGWVNPYQRGTMTLLTTSTAEFHDSAGHTVRFHARAGATGFKNLCD